MDEALSQKSERSANGAEYESQGQARSEAERVAPGNRQSNVPALKGRNSLRISAFQASISGAYGNPGRRASRLPWAFIYRAVGALLPTFEAKPTSTEHGACVLLPLGGLNDASRQRRRDEADLPL